MEFIVIALVFGIFILFIGKNRNIDNKNLSEQIFISFLGLMVFLSIAFIGLICLFSK